MSIKKTIILISTLIIIGGIFYILIGMIGQKVEAPTKEVVSVMPEIESDIKISSVEVFLNASNSAEIIVKGQAKGPWYFEATAPVKLVLPNGNVLTQSYISADGEWMTESFVPFSGTLSYDPTLVGVEKNALLIFENANPSGEQEFAKSFAIPIILK